MAGVSGFNPAASTGGSAYRCTRGCGADVGSPEGQDDHNSRAHTSDAGGGTQYVGGQMAPAPQDSMTSFAQASTGASVPGTSPNYDSRRPK